MMSNIQLSVPQWLTLPLDVRMKLQEIFSLHRTGFTVVEDNRVKSDGFTHEDLLGISIEKMQNYTGSVETDFFKLLDLSIIKIQTPVEVEKPVEQKQASPFGTLSKEEAEQFKNEYNQRKDEQKIAKENEAATTSTTREDKGTTSRRGRPKKGSRKIETDSEGNSIPPTL